MLLRSRIPRVETRGFLGRADARHRCATGLKPSIFILVIGTSELVP
jgi:hypothetical protein